MVGSVQRSIWSVTKLNIFYQKTIQNLADRFRGKIFEKLQLLLGQNRLKPLGMHCCCARSLASAFLGVTSKWEQQRELAMVEQRGTSGEHSVNKGGQREFVTQESEPVSEGAGASSVVNVSVIFSP